MLEYVERGFWGTIWEGYVLGLWTMQHSPEARDVQCAASRPHSRVRGSVHKKADAAIHYRAGAHGAGLLGDIESASRKTPLPKPCGTLLEND